jgi:hypothetical protein
MPRVADELDHVIDVTIIENDLKLLSGKMRYRRAFNRTFKLAGDSR